MRSYATEARRVLPSKQKALSDLTDDVHKGNHSGIVDPDITNLKNPKEIRYYGQLTHGNGTPQHPSQPLHSSKDVSGENRTQRYIPAKPYTYSPITYFEPEHITGSVEYFKDPEVVKNMIIRIKHKK